MNFGDLFLISEKGLIKKTNLGNPDLNITYFNLQLVRPKLGVKNYVSFFFSFKVLLEILRYIQLNCFLRYLNTN